MCRCALEVATPAGQGTLLNCMQLLCAISIPSAASTCVKLPHVDASETSICLGYSSPSELVMGYDGVADAIVLKLAWPCLTFRINCQLAAPRGLVCCNLESLCMVV